MSGGVEPGGHREVDRQRHGQLGVVHHGHRQDRVVHPRDLAGCLGEPPHVGGLGPGVRRGDGDDRQPRRQRHRLGQPGRGPAADADEEVGSASGRGGPGGLGLLHGHVGPYVAVPEHDRKAGGDTVGDPGLGRRGDDHDPAGAQAVDLRGEVPGSTAVSEEHALPERDVLEGEAHCSLLVRGGPEDPSGAHGAPRRHVVRDAMSTEVSRSSPAPGARGCSPARFRTAAAA